MTRESLVLGVCVLLFVGTLPTAWGSQSCKPVVGGFEASVVSPGEGHCPAIAGAFGTAGRVWGGIQGNYEFVMTGASPAASIGGTSTVLFFTGHSTILLKQGDQLLGIDTGSLDLPPGQGGFASLITFAGGSGSMASATGQIRLRGEFSASEGMTSGDYIGNVCAG